MAREKDFLIGGQRSVEPEVSVQCVAMTRCAYRAETKNSTIKISIAAYVGRFVLIGGGRRVITPVALSSPMGFVMENIIAVDFNDAIAQVDGVFVGKGFEGQQ